MKKFFGWLFLTQNYLATLSDEELAKRALGSRLSYAIEQDKRRYAKTQKQLERVANLWRQVIGAAK